jgi:hypothetical protein
MYSEENIQEALKECQSHYDELYENVVLPFFMNLRHNTALWLKMFQIEMAGL